MTQTTSIYRGHSVDREGNSHYTVSAYGAVFKSLREAKKWIDSHVEREHQHVQRQIDVDPALMNALRAARDENMNACACSHKHGGGALATSRYVREHPSPTMAMNRLMPANRMSRSLAAEPLGSMIQRIRDGNVWEKSAMGRARGQMGVDVRSMWELAAGNLYGTADRIVCAAREMLQNSRDAVVKAARRGLIPANTGEIHFKVSKQDESIMGQPAWTLECHDNGPGMSCEFKMDPRTGEPTVSGILPDVFFALGKSGGKDADQTGDGAAVGGFGMAKGIILGVSSTWRFEVATQRAIARSSSDGQIDYEELAEPVRGTTVRVFDIIQDVEERRRFQHSPESRIAGMLAWSNLAGVKVFLNGHEVTPVFDRSRGRRVKRFNQELPWSWGGGITSAEVIVYRRLVTDGEGHFYVQIDGLYQFAVHLGLGWDVVVNLKMAVHAKDPRYPIPISRDGFKWGSDPYGIINQIREELTRDNMSGAREPDYETELPTDSSAGESTVNTLARYLGASIREAADLIRASHEIANSFIDEGAAAANIQNSGLADEMKIPAFAGAEAGTKPQYASADTLEIVTTAVHVGQDDFGEAYTAGEEDDTSTSEGASRVRVSASAQDVGRAVMSLIDEAGLEAYDVPYGPRSVLLDMKAGRMPTDLDDLRGLIEWVGEKAADGLISRGMQGSSGGDRSVVTQVEAATATKVVLDALESLVDDVASAGGYYGARREAQVASVREAVQRRNPFAMFAVKIHKNFPRKSLRSFRRSPKKYLRVIMAWDATLRLIAGTVRIFKPFRVGFVFEDEVRGMQGRETEDGWEYVYINPIYALATTKAFKKDPRAVALYFYGLACHELAHMHHSATGHDERFVALREDVGFAAAHVFRAVEATLRKIFNLSGGGRASLGSGDSALRGRIEELTKRLGEAEANREEIRRAHDILERTRADHYAKWAARATAAESRAEAAEIRAESAELRAETAELRAESAEETYRRLFSEARESIGRTAGRMHSILAFGEYLNWICGSGRELLPEGVDPERFAEALRANPRVVADYLLGDGVMKARQVGEALAGHIGLTATPSEASTAAEAIELATSSDLPLVQLDEL